VKIRLNKYLASCGLGSRRKVEEYIFSGKVRVNGSVVRTPGITVETESDSVLFENKPLEPDKRFKYIILNKPKGYLTALKDDRGRPTVMDLIPEKYKRVGVFPVGRLDRDTEGIIILTNDGRLAHILTGPFNRIRKEYLVTIDRPIEKTDMDKMERGIYIPQLKIKTKPATVEFKDKSGSCLRITLAGGKNRQIRQALKKLGYRVIAVKRTALGPLVLKGVNKGMCRPLHEYEMKLLLKIAGPSPDHPGPETPAET